MPLPPGLPDFPATDRRIDTPAPLIGRGLRLRHAQAADLVWLCHLYATTRVEEMAHLPWSEAMKQAFLTDQFGLQHRHYLAHYGDSDFLVLEGEWGLVGRYYVQRATPDYLLIDISLWPKMRNRGLGRILIEATQHEARQQGCGLQLHVLQHNGAARRLYERLGFVVTETEGSHHRMRWASTP